MKASKESLIAKEKIIDIFSVQENPVKLASSIRDEELDLLLNEISELMQVEGQFKNDTLSKFLYAGCVRFDRWFLPSPYIVESSNKEKFSKFLEAFRKSEKYNPENLSTFEIHEIRYDVFKSFNQLPIKSINLKLLDNFKKKVSEVTLPQNNEKLEEFLAQKYELVEILNSLNDGTLKTELKFSIPYILNFQNLELNFTWHEISCQMKIVSQFNSYHEPFTDSKEAPVTLAIGASRWQAGTSEIVIRIDSLIDASTYTERLQAIEGFQPPIDGWPQCFTIAFEIFRDMNWNLLNQHQGHQAWIPSPRDISQLETFIFTPKLNSINRMTKGSPAEVSKLFLVPKVEKFLKLGKIEKLPWFIECRFRARMYLELGDTNEALFWLNVGVEALFNLRFIEIERMIGNNDLSINFESPKRYWDEAEEVIVGQFPQMAGKITWPKKNEHLSIYKKLKILHQLVPMKTNYKVCVR